jgi:hypothetical protein
VKRGESHRCGAGRGRGLDGAAWLRMTPVMGGCQCERGLHPAVKTARIGLGSLFPRRVPSEAFGRGARNDALQKTLSTLRSTRGEKVTFHFRVSTDPKSFRQEFQKITQKFYRKKHRKQREKSYISKEVIRRKS